MVPETEKLYMEGRIVQKLECRPAGESIKMMKTFLLSLVKFYYKQSKLLSFLADSCYMKLKKESIKKASVPVRQIQQLERVVQNFKPVSDHKHNVSEKLIENLGSGWQKH